MSHRWLNTVWSAYDSKMSHKWLNTVWSANSKAALLPQICVTLELLHNWIMHAHASGSSSWRRCNVFWLFSMRFWAFFGGPPWIRKPGNYCETTHHLCCTTLNFAWMLLASLRSSQIVVVCSKKWTALCVAPDDQVAQWKLLELVNPKLRFESSTKKRVSTHLEYLEWYNRTFTHMYTKHRMQHS